MSPQIEIQLIAVIVAIACALPGVFLVLRKMAMMSDSITHTILLGIVLAFFMTHDLSSPFLILGAAVMGVITVWLTEMIHKTRLVSEDSAIGIVFPLLFSIAIILITRYASSVHLDTDSVLLGELAFAPFERMVLWGHDIGAKSIYTSGILLLINVIFIVLFYKELSVATFDPILSSVIGFSPALIHYGLMSMVSLTAVGAFEAVGSVLVVAFMIGPPVTAYLLTDRLRNMIFISTGIAAASGIIGYHAASLMDVSIAGSMAVVTGIIFLLVFIVSPRRGMIYVLTRRRRQRIRFAKDTLLLHLYHHEGSPEEPEEAGVNSICQHLHWEAPYMNRMIRALSNEGLIHIENHVIKLTPTGKTTSKTIADSFHIFKA